MGRMRPYYPIREILALDEQERDADGKFGSGGGKSHAATSHGSGTFGVKNEKIQHQEQPNGRIDVTHSDHGKLGSVSRVPNTKNSWQAYSKKSDDLLRKDAAKLNSKQALVGRQNTGRLQTFPSKEHAIEALHRHHES
jgi:hypothetical protein